MHNLKCSKVIGSTQKAPPVALRSAAAASLTLPSQDHSRNKEEIIFSQDEVGDCYLAFGNP